MTYQTGSLVVANDINGFLTTVNNVYGVGFADRGYGQMSIAQSPVSVGDLVLDSHWRNLRDMIIVCANHQATVVSNLPPSSAYMVGQPIIADSAILYAWEFMADKNSGDEALGGTVASGTAYILPGHITEIDINRFNTSATSLSVTTGAWTVTRSTVWTNSITAEISVRWGSEDSARYFFNSGGQIRLQGTHPTGVSQDVVWKNNLQNLGTVSFGAHATGNSGGLIGSRNVGFYELTDAYQDIYSGAGDIYWEFQVGVNAADQALCGITIPIVTSPRNIIISAKRLSYAGVHDGNGRGVQFRIHLVDSLFLAAGTSFSFDHVKASTFLTGIEAPVYATVTDFAGYSWWLFEADVNGADEALGGLI